LNCYFAFFGNTHYFGHNANLFIGIKKTISAHGVSNLDITGKPLSANLNPVVGVVTNNNLPLDSFGRFSPSEFITSSQT